VRSAFCVCHKNVRLTTVDRRRFHRSAPAGLLHHFTLKAFLTFNQANYQRGRIGKRGRFRPSAGLIKCCAATAAFRTSNAHTGAGLELPLIRRAHRAHISGRRPAPCTVTSKLNIAMECRGRETHGPKSASPPPGSEFLTPQTRRRRRTEKQTPTHPPHPHMHFCDGPSRIF